MAYWFHRNPLKATAVVKFDCHGVSTSEPTRKIFTDLRINRSKLLELLTDPNNGQDIIETAAKDYFSLLQVGTRTTRDKAPTLFFKVEF